MENTASDASVDLSYYAGVLRRRWKLGVVGLVLGMVAALALLFVQPHRATASALVNVNPIADNAFSSSRPASDLLVPEAEQTMARSTEVVTSVAELSSGTVTPAEVRANTVATLMPDSTVLRIDYTASSARAAADGAAMVAQEYLVYRSTVAQERIDLAVEQLEKRRKKLSTDLSDANQEAARAEGPAKAAAESRAQSIQADLSSVNGQVNQLRAISTSGGTIISHPDADRASLSPNRLLVLFSGFLGGLLLALVLPFVANALDRRVRDSHDVARAGGGAVVATLTDPEAVVPPGEEDADQIRALRERLMAVVSTSSPVVVVADIGSSGAHPTDLAANLAVLVADAGRDTTLLLADYPDEAFGGLIRALGLVEGRFLHGARHFHSRLVPSLMVVLPAPYVDRLSIADVVAGLLQEERRRGSVAVVGVAPGGGHSVRLTAARLADQVVLTVPRVDTRRDALVGVVNELRAVGAPIHGSVLVHGERMLTGDASLVPKHPLAGRGRERIVEEPEDGTEPEAMADPEGTAESEGTPEPEAQLEQEIFSPWFYRAPLLDKGEEASGEDAAEAPVGPVAPDDAASPPAEASTDEPGASSLDRAGTEPVAPDSGGAESDGARPAAAGPGASATGTPQETGPR